MSMFLSNGITVIVPVYNCEKFIGKCIESVQRQTYNDWFLILVDDGSPDNAGAICDQYAKEDEHIKVLHLLNGGPGKARNNGIQHCKTRWFTFLDSDDVIEPDYLANFNIEDKFTAGMIILFRVSCKNIGLIFYVWEGYQVCRFDHL